MAAEKERGMERGELSGGIDGSGSVSPLGLVFAFRGPRPGTDQGLRIGPNSKFKFEFKKIKKF